MSTSVWSTPLDHTSNAGFQAWATELIVKLLAVNTGQLTQTADAGQLANPVVAVRPGTSTIAGYWILKWDDGASTPLYLKIEVGTGSSATIPTIAYTVGTGSNGSGTLTGALTARQNITVSAVATSAVTNWTSHLCCATGGFGMGWKEGSNSTTQIGMGFFTLNRSIDDSGVVNNDGYITISPTNATTLQVQSVNLGNSTVLSTSGTTMANLFCTLIPMGITTSAVSGNAQYFRCFAAYPLGRPLGHLVSVITSEYAGGTSFPGLSGSITDHTFLSLGQASHLGSYNFAILWQ